jgi:D-glycero-alpha-D-manno-heptose-7-phosphate kinase
LSDRVTARAACRVDCAGGTLDIWPIGLLHPDSRTISFAIDVTVTVEVSRRAAGYRVEQDGEGLAGASPDELVRDPRGALAGTILAALDAPPVEVRLASASPRGGGLGASSAMAVALIAGIEGLLERPPSAPAVRVALARDLEARLMGLPTGSQDHWVALLGGALELAHRPGGTVVRHLPADLAALGASLVVAYTGASHFSAGNNWEVLRRRLDGDPESVDLFTGIAALAGEAAEALAAGDLARLGGVMGREWSLRRRLAPAVSTPRIEALLTAAGEHGAWGGKACGAGGGGCVAALAPADRRDAVAAAWRATGAHVVGARPTASPLTVCRHH